MTERELIKRLIVRGKAVEDLEALEDCFGLCREFEKKGSVELSSVKQKGGNGAVYKEKNFIFAHNSVKEIRKAAWKIMNETYGERAEGLWRKCLLFEAPYNFDDYCMYIEIDRESKKRFYMPRRKQLKPIADEMQRLSEKEIELLAVSLPPGVGKTTLAIFFMTYLAGKNPELQILGGSHNNAFLKGVYGECLRIMTPGEYLWQDVFPKNKVVGRNAKDMRIDLNKPKRFETLEFTSVGSGNAGKVRATKLLYCDDLVSGIEQAASKERLDTLWTQYTTDLRQRKQGTEVVELHIATRWSLYDPIGRLYEINKNNSKAKFIVVPALDKEDHSQFNYPYGLGFTDEFYHTQREIMDNASWKAIFMNEPIEREGMLYEPQELRRYFELPEIEPDSILAVCDTKDQGDDFCVLPVAYQYGEDYYIEDFICDNGKPEVIEERLVNKLIEHKVDIARFESNKAGGIIAQNVQKRIGALGGKTHITTKWNQTNKETRIVVSSPWVKRHCVFKDETKYSKEYRTAMTNLISYTLRGKNKHDDVPDAMSMFSDFAANKEYGVVEVHRRTF